MRSISSTNSGLPSATALIRASASASTRPPADQALDQLPVSGSVRGCSGTSSALGRGVAQSGLASRSSAPRKADHQDRRVPGPVGEVLQQLQESRLAPLDVVEQDDDGPRRRQLLEQLADRPEQLLDGGLRPVVTQQTGEASRDQVVLVPRGEQGADLGEGLRRGVRAALPAASRSTSTTGQNVMPSP